MPKIWQKHEDMPCSTFLKPNFSADSGVPENMISHTIPDLSLISFSYTSKPQGPNMT